MSKVATLRASLAMTLRFAAHAKDCRGRDTTVFPSRPCSCGLDAVERHARDVLAREYTGVKRHLARIARKVGVMILFALPMAAQSERDSTIYTATRVRTTLAGRILSITTTKLVALPSLSRVDTVRITLPAPPPTIRVDTVKVAGPATHTYWYPVIVSGTVHYGIRQNVGSKPESFLLPTANRVDTITVVAYYKPNVIGGTVYYSLAAYDGIQPPPYVLPASRVDTVRTFRVDTLRLPPIIVVPPVIPPVSSHGVELPRVYVDTRMPDMPMSGDTLYECTSAGCRCKGPTCAQQAAGGRVFRP